MAAVPAQAAESLRSLIGELDSTMGSLNGRMSLIKDRETADSMAPEIKKLSERCGKLMKTLMDSSRLALPNPDEKQYYDDMRQKLQEKIHTFKKLLEQAQKGGLITPSLEEALLAMSPEQKASEEKQTAE